MMNTSFYRLLLLPLFMVILCSGCGGSKKPDGLPELHPLALTLMQDGQPLADALVSLSAQDKTNKWSSGGTTDALGVVNLKTHGDFPGVPAGKFKVSVIKVVTEKEGKKKIDYSVVDQKLRSSATTTLEVEVVAGKNETTLDVGKAVKIKIGETSDTSG